MGRRRKKRSDPCLTGGSDARLAARRQAHPVGSAVAADPGEPALLQAERLVLVRLDFSRATELAQIYADPEVARFIGADRLTGPGPREQVTAFETVWHEHGYGQSALLERGSGRMVGRAGLHPRPAWNELEIGWALVRDRWGLGLRRAERRNDHRTVSRPIQAASRSMMRASRAGSVTWSNGTSTPRCSAGNAACATS